MITKFFKELNLYLFFNSPTYNFIANNNFDNKLFLIRKSLERQ